MARIGRNQFNDTTAPPAQHSQAREVTVPVADNGRCTCARPPPRRTWFASHPVGVPPTRAVGDWGRCVTFAPDCGLIASHRGQDDEAGHRTAGTTFWSKVVCNVCGGVEQSRRWHCRVSNNVMKRMWLLYKWDSASLVVPLLDDTESRGVSHRQELASADRHALLGTKAILLRIRLLVLVRRRRRRK
jgi:hypothetical protein